MIEFRKPTPYTMNCFAFGLIGRKKKPVGYGYQGWTPIQYYDAGARLPNAGSFVFAGLHAVRNAAMTELAKPAVYQVSIRTNQSRPVYVFNKHTDGRITGYLSREE